MIIDERYIINKYLKPLSKGAKGSFDLEDDTAIFEESVNITSADSFVENIHFFDFLPAKYIALRALGASFSDLASKGAQPLYYSLCIALPQKKNTDQWFQSFTEGLQEFQDTYKVILIGGDLTTAKSNIVISVNVFGFLEKSENICKRANANVNDDIYITNKIGGAYLDFLHTKKHVKYSELEGESSYLKPTPRFEFAELIKTFATASCDVSDGLLLDLERICKSSNVSAMIKFNKIPTTKMAKNKPIEVQGGFNYKLAPASPILELFFKLKTTLIKYLSFKKNAKVKPSAREVKEKLEQISFGDDYELIFCAKKSDSEKIQTLSKHQGLQITKIGSITNKDKKSIILVDEKGKEIDIKDPKGFIHYF